MDRFEAMRVFVAVAEAAGFAAAARRLVMSPPAVTRAVAALEERVGATLLRRTTRVVRLTEAGSRFLADAKRILAELEEAEGAAAGAHAEPRGRLVVTAPVLFGRMHVAPVVLDFLARHEAVSVRTLFVDRVVDIVEEGIDVAVRIAELGDSDLVAVRVGAVRRVVCASPDYLARHGLPMTPDELAGHAAIAFDTLAPVPEWRFPGGARVIPRTRLIVNTAEAAVAAAVAGHGVTRVLSYQIEPELRAGRLAVLLAEFEPPPVPIHVVHAGGRRVPGRVRAFVDFAAAALRSRHVT